MGLTTPEVASISGHRAPRMLFRYSHPTRQRMLQVIDGASPNHHSMKGEAAAPAPSHWSPDHNSPLAQQSDPCDRRDHAKAQTQGIVASTYPGKSNARVDVGGVKVTARRV
jgi:hypothetical protein